MKKRMILVAATVAMLASLASPAYAIPIEDCVDGDGTVVRDPSTGGFFCQGGQFAGQVID